MILLNFLRALSDLGFYYYVAGTLSFAAGGRLALEVLLLQSVCFALSSLLPKNRIVRLAALVPALLLLLCPIPLADILISLPPLPYLAYLVWTDRYQRTRYRQTVLFPVCFKASLVLAPVLTILLGSAQPLFMVGIPIVLLAVAASALLMRSLRHDPAVYLQPGFQVMNFAGIVLVALAALVLSSEQCVQMLKFTVRSFYNYVIFPPLILLAMLMCYTCLFVFYLPFQWLMGQASNRSTDTLLDKEDQVGDLLMQKLQMLNLHGKNELGGQIVIFLCLLLLIAALVIVFKWMAQQGLDVREFLPSERTIIPSRVPLQQSKYISKDGENIYARRIRRQYKVFLRLCLQKRLQISASDTSADISGKALPAFQDERSLSALRDIYQRARYNRKASKVDYLEFKRLLKELRDL